MQGGKTAAKGKSSEEEKTKMMVKKQDLVPPDGGWGWVVVFAFALSNLIVVPILQSFGLLFRGRFEDLGISGTSASVIINVNSAFGMLLGLFSGYLLRSFGYRKIAIVGSVINSIGVILTSYAHSFAYFLITYGIISSVGFNLLASALNLSINTYFRERRGKAVGFGTTAMGLGPVLMPLLISKLMDIYGVTGTALILGGLSLHSIAASLLLQPIKWHMKPKKVDPESADDMKEKEVEGEDHKSCHALKELPTRRTRTITAGSSIDHDIDAHSVYGFETPLPEHRRVGAKRRLSVASFKRSTSHVEDPTSRKPAAEISWWASAASLDTVNLGSSVKIFDEKSYHPLQETDDENRRNKSKKDADKKCEKSGIDSTHANGVIQKKANGNIKDDKSPDTDDEDEPDKEKELTFWQRLGRGIVAFFDLGLLKDPIYVNLMLGMSLAICAEFNFSLLTPFILNDRGFTTDNTAVVMSVIAGLDIVFRFLAPFFSDHYKIEARNMYIIALMMLVTSRTALIFTYSFKSVMMVAVALGVAKGVRTVYMSLVIPSYVPIERLPSASGIQMVTNGILLLAFGPIIGVIRDESGSYNLCIAFMNMLTVVTLSMWIIEILITRYRRRKQKAADNGN
ncbi:monocarboxylate transporter 9-like [Periplaneta americana]|uniref:monocarboxylate transporter 9-like n=1 Tax=Periplaneta americana TaxID=6978 RepID=UPI0037E8710A